MNPKQYVLEDDTIAFTGDKIFNYYDRKAGVILAADPWYDGWFRVQHQDGTSALLNGERCCSMDFAHKQGWLERNT